MYIQPVTWHGVANPSGKDTTMVFLFPEPDITEFFRTVGYHEGDSPRELDGKDWGRILDTHGICAPAPK